ncbi:nitroreductase [Geomicrobium sp. JCM 19055]|uniref:nitroreductase family protein n=1 Tax=Geomicrobium sp. JCM 19055 TaxID=1460649 RepID=UPI00045ED684|nr:nitroreductase [Geomicrobium sp. JCM 19055]GAK01694.1 nitroreductase [Geomicrobium sp. JCM 19055]
MDVFEAIQTRRSIGKVDPHEMVDKETLEKVLEAGNWAPSHYKTEPWKFFVHTGEGRRALGRVLREIQREKIDGEPDEEQLEKLDKTVEKPFRAPIVITIAVEPSEKEKVIEIEEYAAAHAAAQNMLLAAHALGLGAIWRSGKPMYHDKVREFYNLTERGNVVGFIYLGFPATVKDRLAERNPHEAKTVYIHEDIDRINE